MVDEPHDVVKLLVARMESHPEEFARRSVDYFDRWQNAVNDIEAYGNEADKAALDDALRVIRLDEAHEDALDELLNGPERRRQQELDRQYEQQMIMQAAQRNTTQMAAQKYAAQTQTFTPGLRGKSVTGTWIDDTYGTLSGITNTTSVANALQLGSEKLDESLLKKLKGLIK